MRTPQIALYTDFGFDDPYVGQLKAVISRLATEVPVIDLMHDVKSAAYLLAALVGEFPVGTVFAAIVGPGVGSGERKPIVVKAEGRWFVGPGNGLFSSVVGQVVSAKAWTITLRPMRVSPSFHGRDIFAPVAARIALRQHLSLIHI